MQPQVALDTLRRAFRWMHRIRHRRGYGVQSPYAFSLVHDVIYETAPYYAYAALDAAARLANWRTRDARLVFRLFNAFAPKRGALLFPSPAPHGDGRVVKEAATLACPSAEWRCGEDAFAKHRGCARCGLRRNPAIALCAVVSCTDRGNPLLRIHRAGHSRHAAGTGRVAGYYAR